MRRRGFKKYRRPAGRAAPKNTRVLARKAYTMARTIRRTYKPEFKKYDMNESTYNVGTTAGVVHVNPIAQGDDFFNREGNKILGRSFYLNGYIKHNNTATDGQVIKLWLIQDKQQVADGLPTAAVIFNAPATSVTSALNANTVGRFKVLWQRTYTVDPSNEIKVVKMYKKMYLPVRYNGTTGSDIQKNGLYVVYASSDNTNKPTLTYDARFTYNDN